MPDPFVYKTLQAAHAGFSAEESLFELDVEPDAINRVVWCYFYTENKAGIEVWVEMHEIGGNRIRIPAMIYTHDNSYFGFATSLDNRNYISSGNGSILFNTLASGAADPINPFPLPRARCKKISLRGKWPANASLEAFFAVLSLP